MQAERIQTEKILDAICVSPPYFNLKDILRFKDNSLRATIYTEQPLGMEVSPISAAETGRHLAILGTCVLGLEAGETRNYYLAHKASLGRGSTEETQDKELYGIAHGKFRDKRSGIAETELRTFKDEILYALTVEYHVIPRAIFERRFQKYKHEDVIGYDNPYAKNYPLKTLPLIEANRLKLDLDRIIPECCMGHFPSFPAMPVAFLAYQQINAAGILLKHLLKTESLKYAVRMCSIDFSRLAFAGETLSLITTYLGTKEARHMFQSKAYCENDYMGAAMIDLLVVPQQ